MSQEGTVITSLNIRGNSTSPAGVANQNFQNQAITFRFNLGGPAGPTPGDQLIPTGGQDINLSELTAFGGWANFQNRDPTNWVSYGIRDSGTNEYYPLGELLAGESVNIRLSRHLGENYIGTGTGGGGGYLHFMANASACRVTINCFDA